MPEWSKFYSQPENIFRMTHIQFHTFNLKKINRKTLKTTKNSQLNHQNNGNTQRAQPRFCLPLENKIEKKIKKNKNLHPQIQ